MAFCLRSVLPFGSRKGTGPCRARGWWLRVLLPMVCVSFSVGFSDAVHASPTAPHGADPTAKQCLDAYTGGQRARKNGAFIEARRLFEFCNSNACPSALHGDCQQWLNQVEQAMPTSVFQVISPEGRELDNVRLRLSDGETVWLTGQALEFEPGEHQLTFTCDGYRTETRTLTFREGEKQLVRQIVLQPLEPVMVAGAPNGGSHPPATGSSNAYERSGTLVPVWVGLGVGVVGAGGFAYFGMTAREQDEALATCAPNCSTGQVRDVEQKYLLANISLGVGAVGIVGALLWWWLGTDEEAPVSAGFATSPSASVRSKPGSLQWGSTSNTVFLSGMF